MTGRVVTDHSNPAGLTVEQRRRAAGQWSREPLERWEATIEYVGGDLARNEFFLPVGATEAEARHAAWLGWTLARRGGGVEPTLAVRNMEAAVARRAA